MQAAKETTARQLWERDAQIVELKQQLRTMATDYQMLEDFAASIDPTQLVPGHPVGEDGAKLGRLKRKCQAKEKALAAANAKLKKASISQAELRALCVRTAELSESLCRAETHADQETRQCERLRFRIDAMTAHGRKHGIEMGLDECWVAPPDLSQMASNGEWEKGNTTPKQHARFKKHLPSGGQMFDPVQAFLQAGTTTAFPFKIIELHSMIRAGQSICRQMLAEQLATKTEIDQMACDRDTDRALAARAAHELVTLRTTDAQKSALLLMARDDVNSTKTMHQSVVHENEKMREDFVEMCSDNEARWVIETAMMETAHQTKFQAATLENYAAAKLQAQHKRFHATRDLKSVRQAHRDRLSERNGKAREELAARASDQHAAAKIQSGYRRRREQQALRAQHRAHATRHRHAEAEAAAIEEASEAALEAALDSHQKSLGEQTAAHQERLHVAEASESALVEAHEGALANLVEEHSVAAAALADKQAAALAAAEARLVEAHDDAMNEAESRLVSWHGAEMDALELRLSASHGDALEAMEVRVCAEVGVVEQELRAEKTRLEFELEKTSAKACHEHYSFSPALLPQLLITTRDFAVIEAKKLRGAHNRAGGCGGVATPDGEHGGRGGWVSAVG